MYRKFLLILTLALCVVSAITADVPYDSYIYDRWMKAVRTPHFYVPDSMFTGSDLGTDALRAPQGLFVDAANDEIYIVDTGNHRILRLDRNMELIRIYEGFNEPHDVFVTHNNEIYVADTRNNRIVVMNREGEILNEIGRPVTDLIPETLAYFPLKIAVDRAGRLYIVAQGINEGLIELDRDGVFRGFFGAIPVAHNPIDYFWRLISTQEQREQMRRSLPTVYNNLEIDRDGFIYVTSSAFGYWQIWSAIVGGEERYFPIRKLSPRGENILRTEDWFPPVGEINYISRETSTPGPSVLVDIAVEDSGVYHLLDQRRGRVFSYDPDGRLINVFGGMGSRNGLFRNPVALAVHNGMILVLDARTGSLTRFRLSAYGRNVRTAIDDYYSGRYAQSMESWRLAANQNANLEWAYYGIGIALYQEHQYQAAMEMFRIIRYPEAFSRAFRFHRKYLAEQNFGWIVFGFIALIVVIKLSISRVGKINKGKQTV